MIRININLIIQGRFATNRFYTKVNINTRRFIIDHKEKFGLIGVSYLIVTREVYFMVAGFWNIKCLIKVLLRSLVNGIGNIVEARFRIFCYELYFCTLRNNHGVTVFYKIATELISKVRSG